MRARLLAGIAAGALGLAALTALPAAAASTAQLSVFHAVPGTTVDVYVNNKLTLDNFTPGSMAGPLDLAAGTYAIAVTASDAADASAPIIGPANVTLEAGKNYTAVAHLDASGKPALTAFVNDTSTTAAGQGRLTVRHVAAAPAVDVVVGGSAVVSGLTNPNEKVLNLPAGTISASVTAAGTTTPALLGPADIAVKEGTNTIVYAWGSATSAPPTLALATQTIDGLQANPSGVNAGELGLAADPSTPVWPYALGALALLGVVGLALARNRRTRAV
ncbi:DUF4397 domain-containing protein [Cellulomonas sp. McL0617]|uniref:DUF4397 domain-containing protein n=1 Tax=Cellulomonas sp. McL0617 TaxID=3415675 RepID=UPI003CE70C96